MSSCLVEIPMLEYRSLNCYVKTRFAGLRRVRERYVLSQEDLVYYPYFYGEYLTSVRSRMGRCKKIQLRVLVDALTGKGGMSQQLPPSTQTGVPLNKVLAADPAADREKACAHAFDLTLRELITPLAISEVLDCATSLVYYPFYVLKGRSDREIGCYGAVDAIHHTLNASFVSLPLIAAHVEQNDCLTNMVVTK